LVICNATELFSVFIFGAISSYPLQSTQKSVGFPLLSGLKAADALVISNNHSKMELLNGLEICIKNQRQN
jgi:hypothetical protein